MRATAFLSCLTTVMCWAATVWAAPGYSIVPLGFDDLEHTRDDGYKRSAIDELNEAGQVAGTSYRYGSGAGTGLGLSVWLYDGAATVHIGLVGAEHTSSSEYKASVVYELNEAGQVSGYSVRHNGDSQYLGRSAWLYNGATTVNIGLVGEDYTRDDGYKFSRANKLNEAGRVIGSSDRFIGDERRPGRSVWLYDGTTTLDIGLVGEDYTRDDGYKFSSANELNEAGQVIGDSDRYNGGTGRIAWLYDGATSLDIGLVGDEHTRGDGYKLSFANELNEAGQVIGYSGRFNGGSTSLGASAWIYDGTTTLDIGLVGEDYTRDDGYKFSRANKLNEAGQVVGRSYRYSGGGTSLGQSAWLYDGATTLDIGLVGDEHTRGDGYKLSSANYPELNEAGRVIGYSDRYNGGSTLLGQSAWLYDGATSLGIGIGLVGEDHTRDDGYKRSIPRELNEAGQVVGYSERFNGGTTLLGQDVWFYDPMLDETYPLQLSVRSDGYAFSEATYLGEDGLVLGTYTLFDTFDNDLGDRTFYFTVEDGLHDLGSLIDGGLAANGWDWLAESITANGLGQIIGAGKLTSQSDTDAVFLLTLLLGDGNDDGWVDGLDYVLWASNYGDDPADPVGPAGGDFNGDGITDGLDYLVWAANYGRHTTTAVPEPAALSLGLIASLAIIALRCRGHCASAHA